jgi:acetylornithine deacetylase/succinyl-diaminopimelate desuccinylase-like protein
VLEGSGGGPRLVLNGHTDTVPPDDVSLWSVDPFGGAVADAAVWGRGALDMKGGLVCQIACAHVLASLPARPRGTLVLHFACGFVGDFGITTEPTSLAVAVAQRGVAYYRLVLQGRSAHASTPHAGRNPLRALPRVLESIDRYGVEIGRREHPLLAPATCTPTMIRAGVQQNAVPDTCELVVDPAPPARRHACGSAGGTRAPGRGCAAARRRHRCDH